MRRKLPCIKQSARGFTALLLFLLFAAVSALAAADAHGTADEALFWSIEKNGEPRGYLLGTIHSEDPRVLDFSGECLDRLRSSRVFAMEMVPDVSTLERLSTYMNYPPGQRLEPVIGSDRYHALETALRAYPVPAESIERMRPWAALMTLSTPPPVTGFFMDLSLSLRASGNGLEVVGLETLEEQLSFLEEMPLPMQLALLDQAIEEAGRVAEVHGQMVDAYLENNLVTLKAMSDEQLEAVGQSASDYFNESGIDARNRRMAASLLSHLDHRTVFAAVGALHLPGEQGLINLLRRNGYSLIALEAPFAQAPVKRSATPSP